MAERLIDSDLRNKGITVEYLTADVWMVRTSQGQCGFVRQDGDRFYVAIGIVTYVGSHIGEFEYPIKSHALAKKVFEEHSQHPYYVERYKTKVEAVLNTECVKGLLRG